MQLAWHGASFDFVIWGFIHGTYICIEKMFSKNRSEFNGSEKKVLPKNFRNYFCSVSYFSYMDFFRSESFSDSIHIIQKLLNLGGYKLGELSSIQQKFHVLKGFILIGGVCLCEILSKKGNLEVLGQKTDDRNIFSYLFLVAHHFLWFIWQLWIYLFSILITSMSLKKLIVLLVLFLSLLFFFDRLSSFFCKYLLKKSEFRFSRAFFLTIKILNQMS